MVTLLLFSISQLTDEEIGCMFLPPHTLCFMVKHVDQDALIPYAVDSVNCVEASNSVWGLFLLKPDVLDLLHELHSFFVTHLLFDI
jgi:hypothetical protein